MENIALSNVKKIKKLLDYVQNNKNMVRTIDYDDIVKAVENVYKNFSGMPKKHINCFVNYSKHASIYPRSYKYKPMGTEVRLQFVNGKSYVSFASRENCNRRAVLYAYALSDEMKADIINAATESF